MNVHIPGGILTEKAETSLASDKIGDDERPWFEPVRTMVATLDEIRTIAGTTQIALQGLHLLPELADTFARIDSEKLDIGEEARKNIDKTVADAKQIEADQYSGLMSYILVGAWSAFESMLDDLASAWLEANPSFLSPEAPKIKLPAKLLMDLDHAARGRVVLEQLRQETIGRDNPGIAKAENLLASLGLGGILDEETKRALIELQQIRNVVAHRSRRADEHFSRSCPWLGYAVGDPVTVEKRQLYYYTFILQRYALVILSRCRSALHKQALDLRGIDETLNELRTRFRADNQPDGWQPPVPSGQ